MARVPWVYLTVFFLVPLLLVLADLLYLTREVWTVPWLSLVAMVLFGIGIVVAIGAVPTEAEER